MIRKFTRTTIAAALAVLIAFVPRIASACIDYAPMVVEDVREADVVFTGTLIDYEVVTSPKNRKYGLLTFSVDGVLKGKVPRELQLYWRNSTFGMPIVMDEGERMIVAAVRPGKVLPLRVGSAFELSSMRPDLLQVLQAPCSHEFIFPYAKGSATNIQKILNGEDVPANYDYFPGREERRKRLEERREQVERAQARKPYIVAGGVALFLLGGGVFFIRRNRNGDHGHVRKVGVSGQAGFEDDRASS